MGRFFYAVTLCNRF